ncbi:MAG: ParB N-terminal domain-containing protein, partial [Thermofilum sp.]
MLIFLNPDDVIVPPNYITVRHQKQTCEAIRITGFIAPIVVKRENGKYVLVDGYERLMCAKALKMQIPAIVAESSGNILSFALNYVRGRYCGVDILEAVRQLTEQYDMATLAKVLGRSYETVRRYRSVAEH